MRLLRAMTRGPLARVAMAVPALMMALAAPAILAQVATPADDAGWWKLLESNRWSIADARDASGKRIDALFAPDVRPHSLRFAGGRVAISGGCNLGTGAAMVGGGELTISRPATTMMACAPAAMRADAALAEALAAPMKLALADGTTRMTLASAAGTLVLAGVATPESRYGAPTRVFLEVAPARVVCHNPIDLDTTCIEVREIHFDDKGLPSGSPGPWRAFYPRIEGYTHVEGMHEVLRVNRFSRASERRDPLYVLDLVVSTGRAR